MPPARRRPVKEPQDHKPKQPTERALIAGVAQVLRQLDDQRGLIEGQRAANRHQLTDVMVRLPDGTEKTYEASLAELDTFENNLQEDTPPRRWRAAREQAGLVEQEEETSDKES